MQVIADLQLHSRFSRAVSRDMIIPQIAAWAGRKGIGLVATGDWTHPLWFREIQANLEEVGDGLLRLRRAEVASKNFDPASVSHIQSHSQSEAGQNFSSSPHAFSPPFFLLATEVSCIYSQGGKGRRVHILVWVPTLAAAEKINKEMTKRGCNLMSDGRPIVGLTSIQLADLVLTIEPKALIIPAHAWTPWFSLYGSMSGFDSINEAFGPFAKHIYAVETGLSSSPAMNWRIQELDNRAIVSFSDAHSGPKLGREATVFEVPDDQLSYDAIYHAIRSAGAEVGSHPGAVEGSPFAAHPSGISPLRALPPSRQDVTVLEKTRPHAPQPHNLQPTTYNSSIAYTIEFCPEEGKYHYTGHRLCNVRQSPQETQQKGSTCPVCGKPLTIGVMHRVEELASRSEEDLRLSAVSTGDSRNRGTLIPGIADGIQMTVSHALPARPPFVMLVPLQEILSEAIGSPVASPKVQTPYFRLTAELGGEFSTLLQASLSSVARIAGERVAQGIDKVRRGDIVIEPGYDGVFGVVNIWKEGEEKPLLDSSKEQLSMF